MSAAVKPIVVQKYGGASVADPARLGRVADRVAATVALGKRVVVVVSAMGKTTDELLALARTVTPTPPAMRRRPRCACCNGCAPSPRRRPG